MSKRILSIVSVLLVATAATWALAQDWPAWRHDFQRTGRSDAGAAISEPALKYSRYIGGSVSPQGFMLADVNDDGGIELIFCSSGKVVVKDADDQIVWDTPPMGANLIHGVVDINADGIKEVIAAKSGKPANVYFLNGEDGSIEWEEGNVVPDGGYGFNYRTTQLADVDNDRSIDLVIFPTSDSGYAFSFVDSQLVGGVFDSAAWLWDEDADPSTGYTNPTAAGSGYKNPIYGNFDANTLDKELAYGANSLCIMEGDASLSDCYSVMPYNNFGFRKAIDLDGDGIQEICMLDHHASYRPIGLTVFDTVNRRIKWGLWFSTDPMLYEFANGVVDLDGNGSYEIIASIYNDVADEQYYVDGASQGTADHDGINRPGSWTAIVYDASTGAVRGSLNNTIFLGAEDLDGDGRFELVGLEVTGADIPKAGMVEVYNFDGGALNVNPIFARPDAIVPTSWHRYDASYNEQGMLYRPVVGDCDLDGRKELFLVDEGALKAFDVSTGLVIAQWAIPANVEIQVLAVAHDVTGPGQANQVLVGRNDGFLEILDRNLTSVAQVTTGSRQSEVRLADLDGQPGNEIVVLRSDGSMEILDQGWSPLWSKTWPDNRRQMVQIVDLNQDGASELVTSEDAGLERTRLLALNGDGSQYWESIYDSRPHGVLFPQGVGDFDGDGLPDLFVRYAGYYDPVCSYLAVSGIDGSKIWENPDPAVEHCRYNYEAMATFYDINADSYTDILFTFSSLYAISGLDHATLFSPAVTSYGGLVAVENFDADPGDVEILARGVDVDARLFDASGNLVYLAYGEFQRAYYYCLAEADADETDGRDFVNVTSDGQVTAYDGATGRILWASLVDRGQVLPMIHESFEGIAGWNVTGGVSLGVTSPTTTDTAVEGSTAFRLTITGSGTTSQAVAWDLSPFDELRFYVQRPGSLDADVVLQLDDGSGGSETWTFLAADLSPGSWTRLAGRLDRPDDGDSSLDLSDIVLVQLEVVYASGSGELLVDDLWFKRTGPDLRHPSAADLDADGADEIVIGAADGWLYCLDALTGSADWALNLFADVGEPVLADADNDGELDILVSTGDGFLAAIGQSALHAPGAPRELELGPNNQVVNPMNDIDETERIDALGVGWDAVPGANGYRYALLNEHGTPVIPVTDAGTDTVVVLTGLALVPGVTYNVIVQAYGQGAEVSPFAEGDGVLVLPDSTPPVVSAVQATPRAFNPQSATTTIQANLTDGTGLQSYLLEIRSQGSADVLVSDGVNLAGEVEYQVQRIWDGKDDGGVTQSDGRYEITVTAYDMAGQSASGTTTVTLDRVAPAAPVITVPTPGQVFETGTPDFAGTAEASVQVDVTVSGQPAAGCSTAADGSGDWTCTAASELPDGNHAVSAVATDSAGNQSAASAVVMFEVRKGGVPAPTITSPTADAYLQNNRPGFAGTAEAGTLAEVEVDGSLVCDGSLANPQGQWNCQSSVTLSDGDHTAVAFARNAQGTRSDGSTPVAFHVDTTAPAAPVIQSPSNNAEITVSRPVFTGTTETFTEVTVRFADSGVVLCVDSFNTTGTFTCESNSDLADGEHEVEAVAVDQAGNQSNPSASVTFTVKTGSGPDQPSEGSGCGCASADSGNASWLLLALLGLAVLRRRR
ncbi:MAG: hypothetical protein JXR96_18065 [Deltaproteobacteria bacterium]|nr:hypothetical protein [Deltaproteobacteria bacterium]